MTIAPTAWNDTTVGTEFEVQLGKMLDAAKNAGSPKPYLGNRAIQWGRIDLTAAGVVPLTRRDMERFRLRKGDLLVCEGGEVGRAAIWEYDIECYYQKALHRLRTRRGYSPHILLALLELRARSDGFSDYATQTSIAHLPRDKFIELPIPAIPSAEQERIASALLDADGLIAAIERAIAKKRDIKQGMMQELLTGRTRLPGFNEAWSTTSLGDISAFITKGATPTTYGFTWESTGVPFLRSECVSKHGLDMTQSMFISNAANQALRRSQVSDGDILMTITGYVGRVVWLAGVGVANINQHIARVRIKDPHFDTGFVYHYLSQPIIRTYYETIVTGQAYPQISLVQVRNTEIPTPSIEEQRAIADVLTDADDELEALERRLESARAIKTGMMQELLTGRTRMPVEAAV